MSEHGESTTWYRTAPWGEPVVPVEVFRETECFVWIESAGGKMWRKAKERGIERYFRTASEAWDHVEGKAERTVHHAERSLERRREALAEIRRQREEAGA